MTARRRPGRARRVLAALALAAVATACSPEDEMVATRHALTSSGYDAVALPRVPPPDGEVPLRWAPRATTPGDLEAERLAAAGIIWRTAPLDVRVVETVPSRGRFAGQVREYGRAELERRFGPRLPGLDDGEADAAYDGGRGYAPWLLLGGFVLSVGTVLLLVLTRPRRPAAAWAAGYGPPPRPSGGWPPPPRPAAGVPSGPPPGSSPHDSGPWAPTL